MAEFATQKITDPNLVAQLITVRPEFESHRQGILDKFTALGTVLVGHIGYSSQLHGRLFLQTRSLAMSDRLDPFLSELFLRRLNTERVDFDSVLSPNTPGLIIANGIHDLRPTISCVTTRTNDTGFPTEVIGYSTGWGRRRRILLVDSVVRTGENFRALVRMAKEGGAEIAGAICYASADEEALRELQRELGVRFFPLVDFHLGGNLYPAADCPVCPTELKLVDSWKLM